MISTYLGPPFENRFIIVHQMTQMTSSPEAGKKKVFLSSLLLKHLYSIFDRKNILQKILRSQVKAPVMRRTGNFFFFYKGVMIVECKVI